MLGLTRPQEKRDYVLGRVTGYAAILQSLILVDLDNGTEAWTKLLALIFQLARQQPLFREECGMLLCDSVRSLAASKPDQKQKFLDVLLREMQSHGLTKTPEGVALWLTVRAVAPSSVFPKGLWYGDDPLSAREWQRLAKVMREDDTVIAEYGLKSSPQQNLHFGWSVVVESMIKNLYDNNEDEDVAFNNFWTEVVDSKLPQR